MSRSVREAILRSLIAGDTDTTGANPDDNTAGTERHQLAARLRPSLEIGGTELSPGDLALLGELLSKLARRPRPSSGRDPVIGLRHLRYWA